MTGPMLSTTNMGPITYEIKKFFIALAIYCFSRNITAKRRGKPPDDRIIDSVCYKRRYTTISREKRSHHLGKVPKLKSIHWPEAISKLGYKTIFTT
jgi:hypothetical protein